MREYDAKPSPWLLLPMAPAAVVCLISTVWLLSWGPVLPALIPCATLFLLFVIYRLLSYPVRYRIEQDFLVLCTGILRTRIRLRRIERVGPAKSRWPSKAPLSFDRLCLEYRSYSAKNHTVTLYPVDSDAFLEALSAADPGLTRAIGGVYRVTA